MKLLYVWLLQSGQVELPQREIAAALGITQANVSLATKRLIQLGLASRDPMAKPREKAVIHALEHI